MTGTDALVVCVPNFSDGRRADVIEAICDALANAEGARLVYRQADTEHNRLDTTVVGPPDAVQASALAGAAVAVELKRRGDIDGVEQLTRYLELMNRDPHLAPVTGVFAAQEIKPQARTLAHDRGIRTLLLDYDAMRGLDDSHSRLF